MRSRKSLLTVVLSGVLLCGFLAGSAKANPTSGTFFYTTFAVVGGAGGNNYVFKVNFNWDGTNLTLSSNTGIAGPPSVNGADGILFSPNGHLLVGGGDTSTSIYELTQAGAVVTTKATFGGEAEHLSFQSTPVNPNGLMYVADNTPTCASNCVGAVQLSGGGLASNEVPYTVTGGANQFVKELAFDPNNGKYYFGTAADGASGTFGTAVVNDAAKTVVLTDDTTIPGNPALFAHGVVFDPFSGDIILVSANTIQQYDPTTNTIVATISGPGGSTRYDQATVDGAGHLFVASNDGTVTFVDYDASPSKLITGVNTKTVNNIGTSTFNANPGLSGLSNTLDAIALPTSNPPVPEPASLALVGTGLVFAARMWRKKKNNPIS